MFKVMFSLPTEQNKYSHNTHKMLWEVPNACTARVSFPYEQGTILLCFFTLIHGVTSVQSGVPQITSLEQPLPAHSETLTCAALQLITALN